MKSKIRIFSLIFVIFGMIAIIPVFAQESSSIPPWVKGVANWWVQGKISDDEFLKAVEFLINEGFIQINFDEVTQTLTQSDLEKSPCPVDSFLDVSDFDGAGNAYPAPFLKAYCDEQFLNVESNGIPHYTFVQTTPNELYEQNYHWKIPLQPQIASQVSDIPLLGVVGFAVNGLPIYGPNEGPRPDPFGDPVYNELLDDCLGHTAQNGDYHYHAFTLSCLSLAVGNYKESPILGYALDGFPIYGPYGCSDDDCSEIIEFHSSWVKTGDPSTYAWDNYKYVQNDSPGYLDKCNGHYDEKLGYHYRATKDFPYILGCYTGKIDNTLNPQNNNQNQIQPTRENPPPRLTPPPR